jgi:5-(carboxyamino)imidazole ribonucleotide synthase
MSLGEAQPGQRFIPGTTIGILGSGQLGRMLAMAARRMGYGVHVYSPEENTPAGQVADVEISAAYTDREALLRFAAGVDVVTIEFENIPAEALRVLEAEVPVYPQPHVLHTTQHRLREKMFLVEHGIPVAPFHPVLSPEDLPEGFHKLGAPLVLKTAGFGYDGKGQARVSNLQEANAALEAMGGQSCILECFIELDREISVIAARSDSGEFAVYRPVENRHRNHILDVTLAPAAIAPELETQAVAITRQIMDALDMRGLLCVEFFITTDGRLLVNELAPRPHNSGHYTIEAAVCSQFEQQLRVVCGLPLGDTALRQPAAMLNLLGDLWQSGAPGWDACLKESGAYLHLYGKHEPRPARKMGHITVLGNTLEAAHSRLEAIRQRILKPVRSC